MFYDCILSVLTLEDFSDLLEGFCCKCHDVVLSLLISQDLSKSLGRKAKYVISTFSAIPDCQDPTFWCSFSEISQKKQKLCSSENSIDECKLRKIFHDV